MCGVRRNVSCARQVQMGPGAQAACRDASSVPQACPQVFGATSVSCTDENWHLEKMSSAPAVIATTPTRDGPGDLMPWEAQARSPAYETPSGIARLSSTGPLPVPALFDPVRLARRLLRPLGVEVRAFRDDLTLDTHLWRLFPSLGINCVIDVGARVGEYGRFLRRNGYRGRIVSFEPVHASFVALEARARHDPAWETVQLALGSTPGVAEINVARASNFSSFRTTSAYAASVYPEAMANRIERVQVKRLDEVIDSVLSGVRSPRVYLKMDTQGWDLEVFRGTRGCLDRIVALQTEMSVQPLYEGMPDFRESLSEFNRAGFSISGMYRVASDDRQRLIEFDCVMVR